MASQVKFPEVEAQKALNPDGTPIEPTKEKLFRKLREEPLVPAFTLATCVALTMSVYYLKTGQRYSMQRALRWRVGLQGATVAVMVAGAFLVTKKKPSVEDASIAQQAGLGSAGRPATASQIEKLEEQRLSAKRQFEERLREAELKEEQSQKRLAEQAILRASGATAGTTNASMRTVIGKDARNRIGNATKASTPEPDLAKSEDLARVGQAEKSQQGHRRLV